MKNVDIGEASVAAKELFRIVWRGWFVSVTAIFLPLFGIFGLAPSAGLNLIEYFLIFLLVPVIAAVQGVMAGVLVLVGLFTWPPGKRRKGDRR